MESIRQRVFIQLFVVVFGMTVAWGAGEEEIKTEYYPDGSIKSELRYRNGMLNGISRRYDEDGNLSEIEYRDDKREGITRHYFGSTTERIHKEIMFKDDKANGFFREYYYDGTLKTEQHRIDGKPEGECREYCENGALCVLKYYRNGKIDGVLKMYYDSGELKKSISFKNGTMDGETKVFYKSQKIKEQIFYKKGKPVRRRCFSETGQDMSCPEETAFGNARDRESIMNRSKVVGAVSQLHADTDCILQASAAGREPH